MYKLSYVRFLILLLSLSFVGSSCQGIKDAFAPEGAVWLEGEDRKVEYRGNDKCIKTDLAIRQVGSKLVGNFETDHFGVEVDDLVIDQKVLRGEVTWSRDTSEVGELIRIEKWKK